MFLESLNLAAVSHFRYHRYPFCQGDGGGGMYGGRLTNVSGSLIQQSIQGTTVTIQRLHSTFSIPTLPTPSKQLSPAQRGTRAAISLRHAQFFIWRMKKGMRRSENVPPSSMRTLKWAVSQSPKLQVQRPQVTVLCAQASNQIKTYFYFA